MILQRKLKATLILLNALIVILTQKPNCISGTSNNILGSPYDLIPNFQSGAATLENKQQAGRYNYYNITLSAHFNSSYDLAISIQNINSFSPVVNLDFFVNALKRPTLLEIIFAIDPTIKWVNAQIYFLVSARSDFAVGIFVADNAAFLESSPSGSHAKVHYHLEHGLNATSDYLYAIPFISGLRTYDLNINFTFTSTNFNSSSNLLEIELLISYLKFPLESLYISYLIFNMGSDLEITSLTNLTYAPTNVNVFIGMSGISPFNIVTARNSSTTTPIIGLGSSYETQQNFDMIFGINGIIIQTQQSMDLLFRSLTPINTTLSVLECVSKNKCNNIAGTMIYEQSSVFSINSKCLVCMNNGFYNQTLAKCQCMKGYVQKNVISCVKISETCGENSTYNNITQSCKCNNLFINVSNKCVSIYNFCQVGEIYFQNKCIKIVYANAAIANCSSDSVFINKTCVKKLACIQPFILNSNTNHCQCPINMLLVNNTCALCGINEIMVEKTCQCKPGYFRISGKCIACNVNAFFNGITCICFRYYSGDGFQCTKSVTSTADLTQSLAPKGTYSAQGGAIILT